MKGATLKLGEKNPHMEDKPGVSDKQEGKEGESAREKAQGVEKGKTEIAKLLEEVQFAGGVKATEEEKLGVEGKRTAKGDKLKGESTDKDKSETGKRKPEGGKLKYETKPTGQKKATKGEKQGNEDELLAERDISEIEKGNLVEGNKEEDDKKEEGTVFIYFYLIKWQLSILMLLFPCNIVCFLLLKNQPFAHAKHIIYTYRFSCYMFQQVAAFLGEQHLRLV
jgi:hypothetical protein